MNQEIMPGLWAKRFLIWGRVRGRPWWSIVWFSHSLLSKLPNIYVQAKSCRSKLSLGTGRYLWRGVAPKMFFLVKILLIQLLKKSEFFFTQSHISIKK